MSGGETSINAQEPLVLSTMVCAVRPTLWLCSCWLKIKTFTETTNQNLSKLGTHRYKQIGGSQRQRVDGGETEEGGEKI